MANKCNGSIADLDEEARFVTDALNIFFEILERKNIKVSNLEAQ